MLAVNVVANWPLWSLCLSFALQWPIIWPPDYLTRPCTSALTETWSCLSVGHTVWPKTCIIMHIIMCTLNRHCQREKSEVETVSTEHLAICRCRRRLFKDHKGLKDRPITSARIFCQAVWLKSGEMELHERQFWMFSISDLQFFVPQVYSFYSSISVLQFEIFSKQNVA